VHIGEAARYRATVHYDGSAYAGFQVQPGEPTIQGEIEARLARLGIEARLTAAGRTDAGVHATGQEISFPSGRRWRAPELERALNSTLPGDIWIESLREAHADFHPRFQATGRRYEYFVATDPLGRSPHRRRGTWATADTLDEARLHHGALRLLGEGHFGALSKAGQPELGTRCMIERAQWTRTSLGDLRFTIVADRFLHRMVRYLVSTLVEVGAGHRDPLELEALLRGENEVRPPTPAPARGLYLTGVRYPDGWNRGPGVPGLWP
jgi:tRNA pseudouridine38-40 synthase